MYFELLGKSEAIVVFSDVSLMLRMKTSWRRAVVLRSAGSHFNYTRLTSSHCLLYRRELSESQALSRRIYVTFFRVFPVSRYQPHQHAWRDSVASHIKGISMISDDVCRGWGGQTFSKHTCRLEWQHEAERLPAEHLRRRGPHSITNKTILVSLTRNFARMTPILLP